jgi:phosphoglycolate phosphatase-like HAD superfamily hydrolase
MKISLDFDGTIVTCEEKQMLLLRTISLNLKLNIDYSSIWHSKRRGLSTKRALQAQGVDINKADKISRLWQDKIEEPFWIQFDGLFGGVREALKELKEKNASIALLTARKNPWLLFQQIDRLNLSHFFETVQVVSHRDVVKQKAEFLSNWSAELFVGDTESDAAAAELAGVRFLGVSCGQRDSYYLEKMGYDSFPDLQSALTTGNFI